MGWISDMSSKRDALLKGKLETKQVTTLKTCKLTPLV